MRGPCDCRPVIIDPPRKKCDNCLQAANILLGCADGPEPCGQHVTLDLTEYNDTSVCNTSVLWKVKRYNVLAFENVTISSSGILDFDTKSYYRHREEFEIVYEIDCQGSLFRSEGIVKVCMKNPCSNGCKDCNPCTSDCLGTDNADINATITGDGCPQIIHTLDLKSISTYAACGTGYNYTVIYPKTVFSNVTVIDGIVSFSVLPAAISGKKYTVKYKMHCPEFNIKKSGEFYVTVKSKCHDVICGNEQTCDECTGGCVDNQPEILIQKKVIS